MSRALSPSNLGVSLQFCEVSPERLVNARSANGNAGEGHLNSPANYVPLLASSDVCAHASGGHRSRTILGNIGDPPPANSEGHTWARWSSRCHWRCRPCTDRLAILLTRSVQATVSTTDNEHGAVGLVTLSISPPPGTTLAELRLVTEAVVKPSCIGAVWRFSVGPGGLPVAYAILLTRDRNTLETRARVGVCGDSRAAKVSPVRGSDSSWSSPEGSLGIHIGRVVRHLARISDRPPMLLPGYRFGAHGVFASLLAIALAQVRREHPCKVGGHGRTRNRAGEVSPDASNRELRMCRWCDLPVEGRQWRHERCSTRRWRAKDALQAVLGPLDSDGFLYRV